MSASEPKPKPRRPIPVVNWMKNETVYDTLCLKADDNVACNRDTCYGAVMFPIVDDGSARPPEVIIEHAKEFLRQYYASIKKENSPAHKERIEEVENAVKKTGTYHLKEAELSFGIKLAWRNTARCIMRIQWSRLQIFDCRNISTAREMFTAICNHIKYSTNKGNIRSAITVFPPRIGDRKYDFRIWNPQLINHAGYVNPKNPDEIIGDPANVELTQLCEKLGWKGQGGRFDILPLVLQACGKDPEIFELPEEIVMRVTIEHPKYDWFKELGIKWYVVPAVASLLIDIGGIQFPAAPFNGWYMVNEIACRNLCDPHRYNMLKTIGEKMNLDTRSNTTFWKDQALVEINYAVLHSFQKAGVSIVDHHSAAESFMKHYEKEQKLRGGCPADWVWIVPPVNGALTPVFHLEMINYKLRPSFEYQKIPWKVHVWQNEEFKKKRRMTFKEVAKSILFTSSMFGKALSKRTKATIIYGSETGKSEDYAKRLGKIFSHGFNQTVVSMDQYDVSQLEHESLLLVVTSTFGNGEPPGNGEYFAKRLHAIKATGDSNPEEHDIEKVNSAHLRFSGSQASEEGSARNLADEVKPLSNVKFGVFALGSSAYPNFCAFGQHVDDVLSQLGAERVTKCGLGDELCGEEQAFSTWSKIAFHAACEAFSIVDELGYGNITADQPQTWSADDVKVVPAKKDEVDEPIQGLTKKLKRNVFEFTLNKREGLHPTKGKEKGTIAVQLECVSQEPTVEYKPGDHIGIFAENSETLVNGILEKLGVEEPESPIKVLVAQGDKKKEFVPHSSFPVTSPKEALTRYVDITTPPSQQFLRLLLPFASDEAESKKLQSLVDDSHTYEQWKENNYPNLLDLLQEFKSLKPPLSLLLTELPRLQARFYSISSSLRYYSKTGDEDNGTKIVDLTVAVVSYTTKSGSDHYGVCSNFLADIPIGHKLYGIQRNAPNFRLPEDSSLPIVMVGPGTGIAPFRSFWLDRFARVRANPEEKSKFGKLILLFGCRVPEMELYKPELEKMKEAGVVSDVYTAFSRHPKQPKAYVQDIIKQRAEEFANLIVKEKGHVYVCGDVSMADGVCKALDEVLRGSGSDAQLSMNKLREESRYHEDVFGITLRTAEVTSKVRGEALTKIAKK